MTTHICSLSALALCLALTALSAESPESASPPRLAGIVSLADRPSAVLEVAGLRHSPARLLILSEGQRDEDVEIEKIVPDKGSVKLIWEGAGSTTVRLNNATNLPVPGIVLEDAGITAVLQLFAQFTNRTLLRWPHLPAIALTAYSMQGDKERMLAAGFDGYVGKPINAMTLVDDIVAIMNARQSS